MLAYRSAAYKLTDWVLNRPDEKRGDWKMDKSVRPDTANVPEGTEGREEWVKPEFTTFLPVSASEGISYRPLDGISNLT